MRHTYKILLLLIALAVATPASFAQDATTQGKEFWLSFISNGFRNHPQSGPWIRVQLLVSAKRSCEGTITNPNTRWSRDFTVEANNIFSIDLDIDQVYLEDYEHEQVINKGLQITSTDTVSVYCANIATYSFDASFVLPTPGLADDYIIQTYDQSNGIYDPTSAFVIVATEDDTTIDITPSVKTLGGKPANQEFTITLNKGQAYQVRSHDSSGSRDLSGTRVTARDCKKIAIFNGNNLTLIPTTARNDLDCVFEQAMPIRSWGKKFVVTSSLGRDKDYVKITSAADGNEIRRNGVLIQTLNANQSYVFKLESNAKACYLESTHRCAVYLFNTSSEGSGNGAPSMLWIAPIEQRIEDITFSTFNYNHTHVNIDNHYVNIIVETQDVGQVYLDNTLLPAEQFETLQGNNHYSFCRKKISHGVHHLHCPNGFNAHIYGFDDARGYAYMAGSKAADLSTSILVNEIAVNPYDTVPNCDLDQISFLADVNLTGYDLEWDFGDGSPTSNDNPATHQYDNIGLYEASLTVTTQEAPCGGTSTTNTYHFYIDSRRDPDQVLDTTVCFKTPDTFVTAQGFELYYDEPGTYHKTFTITNESGCKSYFTLNLTVNELIDLEPEPIHGECNSYEWNGHVYTESGHYTDTVAADTDECYKVHHLDLDLDYSPKPRMKCATPNAVIYGQNADTIAVITNTEFFSFQYDFYVEDTLGHIDGWENYDWHISKPSWALKDFDKADEPNRHYCRVYVAEHTDEYVVLSCKASNHCDEDSAVFYLKSSFFGIDGHETTSSGFSIVPNPNKGEMDLLFENLTGKISVKVYDMRGLPIAQIETYNEADSKTLHYSLEHVSSGIYFFVATAKEGTIAKKVIIE